MCIRDRWCPRADPADPGARTYPTTAGTTVRMTDGPMLVPVWVSVRPGGRSPTRAPASARPSSAPSSPPSSGTFSPLDPLGLHVDTTALTELFEPGAAADAATSGSMSCVRSVVSTCSPSGSRGENVPDDGGDD